MLKKFMRGAIVKWAGLVLVVALLIKGAKMLYEKMSNKQNS